MEDNGLIFDQTVDFRINYMQIANNKYETREKSEVTSKKHIRHKWPLDLKRQWINIDASGAQIQTVARFFNLSFLPRKFGYCYFSIFPVNIFHLVAPECNPRDCT